MKEQTKDNKEIRNNKEEENTPTNTLKANKSLNLYAHSIFFIFFVIFFLFFSYYYYLSKVKNRAIEHTNKILIKVKCIFSSSKRWTMNEFAFSQNEQQHLKIEVIFRLFFLSTSSSSLYLVRAKLILQIEQIEHSIKAAQMKKYR